MILINGEEKNCINVSDRGLQFGDGLFETMSVRNGKIRFLQLHLERLHCGCERLAILPPDNILLKRELAQISAVQIDGVIKLVLTRGDSPRGYRYTKDIRSNRIITHSERPTIAPDNALSGVRIKFCLTRIARNPLLAGIKHLNRLENVIARAEWQDESIAEGLLCDTEGYVVEGTMSNLFFIKNNELITPTLEYSGVNGIVRKRILQYAKDLNINCIQKSFTVDELSSFDAGFVCNSIIGIWPIRELIDRIQYSVDHTIIRKLQNLFENDDT